MEIFAYEEKVSWHNHHSDGDLQLADSNLSFKQKRANFWKEMAQISTLTTEAAVKDEASLTVLSFIPSAGK